MKDGIFIDNGSGDWLMRWFAPWLSKTFPNPARQGELRWCYMRRDGDRLVTIWVEGPGSYDIETGELRPDATDEDINLGKVTVARSRTFIRSLLKDNAFLRNSGYAQRMASTPEPLKSMLLLGRFDIKAEDHPFQTIPTNYVLAAQQRWVHRKLEKDEKGLKQLVLSADIAQGGADTSILAELYETDFFEDLHKQPGRLTPTGREVVAMILKARRDSSLVVLDGTGGWAGSTTVLLEDDHSIQPVQFLASAKSTAWSADMVYTFLNQRAEMWWGFREALDPKSGFDIALPPDDRLLAQLTTPQFRIKGNVIQVESKEDIAKRLQGASTDEADAVLQAWLHRDLAIAMKLKEEASWADRVVHGISPKEEAKRLRIERNQPSDLDSPLKDW
jgi:hypothetical protein